VSGERKVLQLQGRARADRTVTSRLTARPRDGMGREDGGGSG